VTDDAVLVTSEVLAEHPLPDHGDASSKDDRGCTLVVGGTTETPGAVLLAGVAALLAGAGQLQLATAASAAVGLAVAVPEARVIGIEGGRPEAFDAAAAEQLDRPLETAAAVLVGPGTFTPDTTRRLVARAVEVLVDTEGVLVLDAGSLPLLAEDPDLVAPLGPRAVVMPNPSEVGRMLDPDGAPDDEVDPGACVTEAVERFGCVVTVRGGDSWTAQPGSPTYLDRAGVVGLATSGSGDVLAGLIAGLAARGADPLAAVLWATQAHGRAGQRCTVRSGPVGFLARDLLDEVGPALVELSS
jgi:ADP-dependent NAD(P)H-hydrate dehydratase